jgi:hypothetical protein
MQQLASGSKTNPRITKLLLDLVSKGLETSIPERQVILILFKFRQTSADVLWFLIFLQVNQLCAIWCAEAARPFSALVEESHKALLHPTIKRSLPGRQTVSSDIHMLYSAIQEDYKAILKVCASPYIIKNPFFNLNLLIHLIDLNYQYPDL